MLRRLAAVAAMGLAGAAVTLAAPAHADEGHFPAGGWTLYDTTIGGDVDWADCDPGPTRTDASKSTIIDPTTVDLTAPTDAPAPPHYGTSIETGSLGLGGDTVTVDYELSGDASFAAGAVRLFIYSTNDADTDCTAPDALASADAMSGTLTVSVPGGVIGTLGLVYDSSNGGTGGTVRFSNLRVDDTLVLFQKPAEPEPEPEPEPTDGQGGADGDDDKKSDLPATSGLTSLPVLLGAGGLLVLVGGGAVLLGRRRRGVSLD